MRNQVTIGALSLALLAGLCAMGWQPAVADDKPAAKAPATPNVWIYDVRMVRVDPATPEGAEKPGPFADLSGTTTRATWPEALAALKNRGQTTLLMDQRVTALESEKGMVETSRSMPMLAASFADDNNRQLRSLRMMVGCQAALLTGGAGGATFSYDLEVKWTLHHPVADLGSPEVKTRWSGSHTTLAGKTLVLHSREQVLASDGKSLRAVEIYALVTGRLLGAK